MMNHTYSLDEIEEMYVDWMFNKHQHETKLTVVNMINNRTNFVEFYREEIFKEED